MPYLRNLITLRFHNATTNQQAQLYISLYCVQPLLTEYTQCNIRNGSNIYFGNPFPR